MSGIMLVSADKDLSKRIKEALRETTIRISIECANGKDAVDTFAKSPAPMVILDFFIPESSGLEVLKNLKKMDENCLFVLLNRIRTRASIDRAYRTGAHDILQLPVSADILRDTILHRLESRRLPTADAPEELPPKQA